MLVGLLCVRYQRQAWAHLLRLWWNVGEVLAANYARTSSAKRRTRSKRQGQDRTLREARGLGPSIEERNRVTSGRGLLFEESETDPIGVNDRPAADSRLKEGKDPTAYGVMSQVCPECGSNDTIHFLTEVGHQVCSNCATVFQDLQLYQPTDVHDVAYALGAPQQQRASSSFSLAPLGPDGKPFWPGDREHQRHLSELRHKPEVDARIRGTLRRLGHPGLFQQVEFLFQRARDESWKPAADRHTNDIAGRGDSATDHDATSSPPSDSMPPRSVPPRVRWGTSSLLLAAACCYVVLRRQGVHTDLGSVSDAAQLPYPKVRLAFKRLRLLVKGAVQNIRLADPDAFVRRIVAFFCCHLIHTNSSPLSSSVRDFLQPFRGALPDADGLLKLDPARIFHKTPFEAVESTALDLCTFWWPNRHPSASGQLAAFAAVVLAFEAHLKALAPIWDMFRCTYAALDFDPRSLSSPDSVFTSSVDGDAVFSRNAKECYKEICAAIRTEVAKIPWLSDAAPISQKRRSKLRSGRQNAEGMSDLARLDVVIHALDVLDVRRGLSSKGVPHDQGPTPQARSDKKEADRRTSAHHGQETHVQDSPERELDDDELVCFLSTSPRISASAMRPALSAGEPYSSTEDAGDEVEVWPLVQQRLEAAGALHQRDVDPESKSCCHPIDLLTDEQVDDLLFDSNELSSFFRTDAAERAVFERTKVAAGDWPSQSKQERDAEFATLARSLDTKSLPPAKSKAERNNSTPPSSPAAAPEGDTTRKRAAEALEPAVVAAAPSDSQRKPRNPLQSTSSSRPTKRVKAPLPEVSLRAQEEESDWSD
ncbi:siderophore transcription factor [Pseudozyma hubeiensis SY62]|uniref:Siderophore transcription factor n=1 Tax=Pseudozyma hubeiensis (strain SY62) TaxID=1305764 RepID=R9P9R4_PSEHS|nr:siderophore transcription factor [Pseudozyma hubeiensis SY62]GAC97987.1 siderophore transcription factor [Pseudozyma hubeiensis SY62]